MISQSTSLSIKSTRLQLRNPTAPMFTVGEDGSSTLSFLCSRNNALTPTLFAPKESKIHIIKLLDTWFRQGMEEPGPWQLAKKWSEQPRLHRTAFGKCLLLPNRLGPCVSPVRMMLSEASCELFGRTVRRKLCPSRLTVPSLCGFYTSQPAGLNWGRQKGAERSGLRNRGLRLYSLGWLGSTVQPIMIRFPLTARRCQLGAGVSKWRWTKTEKKNNGVLGLHLSVALNSF